MSLWKTLTKIGNAVIEEGMKQQSKQMGRPGRVSSGGRNEVETIAGKTLR